MATLTVGGARVVAYDDIGEGPALVLVHGSPGTARSWGAVAKRLSDRFRLIMPNLPGYGGSDANPDGLAETADAADCLDALISSLKVPVLLGAHSYGANVALATALGGNPAVKGLVLFEAVTMQVLEALGIEPEFAAAKAVFDDYIASFEAGEPRAVSKMIDYWFGRGAFVALPEAVRNYLLAHTAHNVGDVRAAFRERHRREALAALSIPVLAVYGGANPTVTRHVAEAIAGAVAHGKARELPTASHGLLDTHAATVATMLAEQVALTLDTGP